MSRRRRVKQVRTERSSGGGPVGGPAGSQAGRQSSSQAGKQTGSRGGEPLKPGESTSRWKPWRGALVGLLTLLAVLYLIRFITVEGLRLDFYQQLVTVYLLLPDALFTDFLDLWTDERWGAATVLDRVPVLLGASIYLLAGWGTGRLLLATVPKWLAQWTGLEVALFSLAIGLNFWSSYVVLLGWIVGFHWPLLLQIPMVLLPLAGMVLHFRGPRLTGDASTAGNAEIGTMGQPTTEVADRRSGGTQDSGVADQLEEAANLPGWRPEWLLLILVPILVIYFLTAALPPWEFDVREYHLQVPKEWFQAGRVTFLPHNVYGNMPLGAEMPALIAAFWIPGSMAWWWGALVGKVVIASLAVATSLAIYAFGCRHFHPWAGVIGVIVYLTTPWVFHVSVNGLVEGALGFYLFLALQALLMPSSHPPSPSRTSLLTSGYLAGAAVACKYTGLVFVVFPLLLLVGWRCRSLGIRGCSIAWTLFLALVVLGCGVWFAKNLALTGNPTYPLLYSLFGGESWDEEKNARWQAAHGPQPNQAGYRYSWAQLRASLIDLGWYSDKLTPLLVPLLLFALLHRQRRDLQAILAAFLLSNFVTWWLLTHRYDRFFVPNLPVLAVLGGLGGAWLASRSGWRVVMLSLLSLTVLVNTLLVSSGILTGDNRILVPLEVLRVDAWRSPRVHPAHRYLNQHVPAGHAALLVGEAQVFDLEIPIYYSTCWDDCFLEIWMKGKSREERLEALRQRNISHVFVHWHEIERYRSPGNYGFTDFVTHDFVLGELVEQQGILRPIHVPTDDGWLDPDFGQVFEVVGD